MLAFAQPPAQPRGALEDSFVQQSFLEQIVVHQNLLRRLANRMTRNKEDAEDLIQETCFRALRYRHSYVAGESGIGPWLATILRNVSSAGARADGRARRTHEAARNNEVASRSARSRRPPAVHSYHDLLEHLDGRLARAIHSLPMHYRHPLILWAIDGMNYEEIAAWLQVPIGTVLSRLARARAQLGERIGELAAEWQPGFRPQAGGRTRRRVLS